MLFDDDRDANDDGFLAFVATVSRIGEKVAKRVGIGIIGDAVVLRECYLSARQSITFHGRGEGSHLKQAGHCCYWIAKLKPLSFTLGASDFAGQLIKGKIGLLGGTSRVDLRPALDEIVKAKDSVQAFPLNEYCGIAVGHTMAIAGLNQLAERARNNGDVLTEGLAKGEIADHERRFAFMARKLVKSLRFNNYSARATATMFEWVYDRPREESVVEDALAGLNA